MYLQKEHRELLLAPLVTRLNPTAVLNGIAGNTAYSDLDDLRRAFLAGEMVVAVTEIAATLVAIGFAETGDYDSLIRQTDEWAVDFSKPLLARAQQTSEEAPT